MSESGKALRATVLHSAQKVHLITRMKVSKKSLCDSKKLINGHHSSLYRVDVYTSRAHTLSTSNQLGRVYF